MSIKDWPSFLKKTIGKEDQQKLVKAIEVLEADRRAFDFLEPVDYIGLGLMDYPTVITHPMDLSTLKTNVMHSSYETMQDFYNDFNLIWENCRTYNIQGSEICKLALHCEKVFKKQMDKLFKTFSPYSYTKPNESMLLSVNNELSANEKTNLTDKIRVLSNEGLVEVIKIIKKECPKGIEEIGVNKIQIRIDNLDKDTYNSLLAYLTQ